MESLLFDSAEQATLNNAGFYVLKAQIDLKITALLQALKGDLIAQIGDKNLFFTQGLSPGNGRLYQGEHHGPFPWRALDFPVNFSKQDHFTFRTLLLWGHHFSFHLLLSGKWLDRFLPKLVQHLPDLAAAGLQISLQSSQWEWNFNSETHLPLDKASPHKVQELAAQKGFLKLSRLHPLSQADTLRKAGLETWKVLQNSLS